MGKVLVDAKVENLKDLYLVESGALSADQARAVRIDEALVDTGATMLSLPRHLCDQLGLRRFGKRPVRTSAGSVERTVCDAVRLTIQGRECTIDVLELTDDCPVLIGQVPLELLDFVVDPVAQRLIGNPEHGGEHMVEAF